MNYITNATAIILLLSNGERIRIEKNDKNYAKVLNVFSLPPEEQEDALKVILAPVEVKKQYIHGKDGFEVVDETVYYQGEELPPSLVQKVLSVMRDGLPLIHFEKFWQRLQNNPSSSSVKELTDFLSYKELPITEDGYFIAYKGVDNDYYSVHGNTKTKVIKGTVDDSGRIFNGVGEEIEVVRRDVCDNRDIGCSEGLHVGSHDYAKGWGTKMVIVKVDPADVVSVPSDCSFQKCRVCKYVVVGEYEEEIQSSVVDDDGGDTVATNDQKEFHDICQKIENYLEKKENEGVRQVTIRQIQNIFSPNWLPKEKIFMALQELWYDWEFDEEIGTNVVTLNQ